MNIERHAIDVVFLDIDGVMLPYSDGPATNGTAHEKCEGCETSPELPLFSCDRCPQQHRDCCEFHTRYCEKCNSQLCGKCYQPSACAAGSCAAGRKRGRIEPAAAEPAVAAADVEREVSDEMSDDSGEMSEQESNDNLFPELALEALDRILQETGAIIVLSSSWRMNEDAITSVLESFRQYGGALKNVRDFESITPVGLDISRQHEIQMWLLGDEAQKVRAWVALDDVELVQGESNAVLAGNFEGHVVKTQPTVGLTIADAELAIAIMKAQGCVKPLDVVSTTMADFINAGDY